MTYAEGTEVTIRRSQEEVTRLLKKVGAVRIVATEDEPANAGVIMFELHARRIQVAIPYPALTERRFALRPRIKPETAWEAEKRRLWRVAVIRLKVDLETTEGDAAAFQNRLLPYTVLPNGRTVGEMVTGAVEDAVATGTMPTFLLGAPSPRLLAPPQIVDVP